MSRWIRPGDDESWRALLTSYEVSSYRLECQQVYASPEEDEYLTQFLSGQRPKTSWGFMRATAGSQIAAGRTKTRVRVVVEPATLYTEMALTIYPELLEIGEDIRFVGVQQGEWPEEQPHHDYWIFDDRELWLMHYHENFRWKGAERIDDPAALEEHRAARDRALAMAVSLDEYLASRPSGKEPATE
ncbi:DUF6879 family protein [Pseudonocardia sp. CA-107938]|uniref:DUF6879 family protein n=1 Tax=Pseudonocardia sp. CA-107938 TaxID=3240021 RepID=UPI003D8B2372